MASQKPLVPQKAPSPATQAQVEEWVRIARKGRGWITKVRRMLGTTVVEDFELGDWDLLPQTQKKMLSHAMKPGMR